MKRAPAAGRRPPPAARGFSLIEVLVAMVIFAVGATSVIALLAAAAQSHKRSVDQTLAALVAERIIAEVQARYGPGMEPGKLEEAVADGVPGTIDGYTWSVNVLRPAADAKAGGRKKLASIPFPTSTKSTKAKGGRPASAAKTAKDAKTARDAKGRKEPAKDPEKEKPTATSPDGKGEGPAWSDDEIVVRVTVEWSQAGRSLSQTFDTILLPRLNPLETRPASTKK